jgi:hypothetical protein
MDLSYQVIYRRPGERWFTQIQYVPERVDMIEEDMLYRYEHGFEVYSAEVVQSRSPYYGWA